MNAKHITHKILAALLSVLMLSALLTGCSTGSSSDAAGSTDAANEAAASAETKVYSSADGWELTYEPSNFTVSENNGAVRFTCTMEDTGADYFEISYVKGKLPKEVLYEQIADVDDSRVTRGEGFFGGLEGDWRFTYIVEPAEGEDIRRQYDGIEHNGGTLLISGSYKTEADDDKAEQIGDTIAETMSTLRFTNHEPQQEFSYVPGTYERSYKEELEGKEETITEKIVLNADHTGTYSAQDDVPLIWSSWELIVNQGEERFEYTVEGDNLMVKIGEEWVEFNRVK